MMAEVKVTRLHDLTGQRFGRLVVLRRDLNPPRKETSWFVMCDCGQEKSVQASNLNNGHVKSCGCLRVESRTTHGCAGSRRTPEYHTWSTMIQRCTNPSNVKWSYYGARGITVCDRWRKFENFFADVGRKPSPAHELDRIDNDGNYEPSNVRWVTEHVQSRNKRSNVFITFGGESLCLADWAHRLGIGAATLKTRLAWGWGVERAFTQSVQPRRQRP